MPVTLEEGDEAPDFTLSDANGKKATLSRFRGRRRVVVYFYPKDDTPGCTAEACSLRDDHSAILAANAEVIGISADDEASHAAFAKKYRLPFTLLADTDGAVCRAWGVWEAKRGFALRTTFIVGIDGRIEKIFENVVPSGHGREIIAALGE